jgi:molybdenum cofactor cytidylyltransferase
MPDFHCAAVVLAAGASTRLGQPKQLIRIDGESLLHRTARLALEAGCSPVYVVLGFQVELMRAGLAALPVSILINENWQEGMGSSLRSGMNAIQSAEPPPEAVLILVCDQPRLTAGNLRNLISCHRAADVPGKAAIIAAVYAGRAGVPAVFPSGLFPELSASRGDRGARDLIQAHTAEVQGIPWPEGELDVDSPEDLDTIERQF